MGIEHSILGGIIIGLAAAILLIFDGRTAGISGIAANLLHFKKGDFAWRLSFVLGLGMAGFVLSRTAPDLVANSGRHQTLFLAILSGLLVGIGARMANGCTSGHGVCGISRGSLRSIVATVVFMAAGVLAAYGMKGFFE